MVICNPAFKKLVDLSSATDWISSLSSNVKLENTDLNRLGWVDQLEQGKGLGGADLINRLSNLNEGTISLAKQDVDWMTKTNFKLVRQINDPNGLGMLVCLDRMT